MEGIAACLGASGGRAGELERREGGSSRPADRRRFDQGDESEHHGVENAGWSRGRIGYMPNLVERSLKGAGFLGDARAHALARIALDAGALLLPREAVNGRRTGQGQAKRHRKAQRRRAESQIAEPGKSLLHLAQLYPTKQIDFYDVFANSIVWSKGVKPVRKRLGPSSRGRAPRTSR